MIIIFKSGIEESDCFDKGYDFGGFRAISRKLIPEIEGSEYNFVNRFPQILYFLLKINELATTEGAIKFFQ